MFIMLINYNLQYLIEKKFASHESVNNGKQSSLRITNNVSNPGSKCSYLGNPGFLKKILGIKEMYMDYS